MTAPSDLEGLLARVEGATGADRELDARLRETIARIIDPEAWEPWEGYPIGQRAALEKADLVLALPQLAETSAAVGVLLEYDGEFDTGYRFIKTGDTPRPEWLRGVTTTPLFALPQLASVGRDSSSQSQPGADAGHAARARTEAEGAAAMAEACRVAGDPSSRRPALALALAYIGLVNARALSETGAP